MKLTYWVANCLDDSAAYSIRARTRREVVAELAERNHVTGYGKPRKVTLEYSNAFDILRQCLSEGSIDEGRYDEAVAPRQLAKEKGVA